VLALIIATLVAYFPVNHYPFLTYDDNDYISSNDQIKAGLTAETLAWAFTTYRAANWHPLTWLSHALDIQLFGLDAPRHHDVNLLLHMLNVGLLFWVLAKVTGNPGRSLMVAALFALHPINVESVAWIAERKDLLSMTFLLLALAAYEWYVKKPHVARYAVVALLFAGGLMAKPQVITLPFVLLLWDYWPLQRLALPNSAKTVKAQRDLGRQPEPVLPPRTLSQLVIEKAPLFVLSVACALITMRAQRLGGGVNPTARFSDGLRNAVVSYVRYVDLALWPSNLAVMYPYRPDLIHAWQVASVGVLLIAITVAVIRYRRFRYLPMGWFWFLGTLVPMIGIVSVGRQAMADRYAYLPFIGLFIILCWGFADCAKRLGVDVRWQAAAGVALLLALAIATHRQVGYWSSDVALWSRALQVTQGNYFAEDELGISLQLAGKQEEAIPHYLKSLEIEPSFVVSHLHIGAYLLRKGDYQGALLHYEKALALTEGYPSWNNVRYRVFLSMASAYASLGNLQRARDFSQQALKINPDSAQAWTSLGGFAHRAGDFDQAIQAYSQAVRLQPSQRGFLLLAAALRNAGKPEEAQAAAQQAAAFGPMPEQPSKADPSSLHQ
jgi:Tfp pilus assembly protein PilF